jgi:glutamate-1-semialdehyde 2,1-aminomutase
MVTTGSRSEMVNDLAARYIPGGVSSNNRHAIPELAFTRAQGAYIFDADGRRYVDYHAAFGPPILGHCHPEVVRRAAAAMAEIDPIGVGASELEARLAQRIVAHVPSVEKVAFCNSGSEATYVALRLARAVTGRRELIKFQGCYHGWHDAVAMNVISRPDRIGRRDPLSAGMTPEVVEDTLVLPFNDSAAVRQTFDAAADSIAAVILEPIPHNIGCVMPDPTFLATLREVTHAAGAVLIFDEVITGFRHGLGGYQAHAGVTPDLTTLGKAIANGFPLAALGGRADLMDHCAPGGDVFLAGTFNGHPASVAAALATIEILEQEGSYEHLFGLGERVRRGLDEQMERLGIETTTTGFGSVFITYFMSPPIASYSDLLRNDADRFVAYRRGMIDRGFYMLPVNLKRNHISLSHTAEDVDRTLQASEDVLRSM